MKSARWDTIHDVYGPCEKVAARLRQCRSNYLIISNCKADVLYVSIVVSTVSATLGYFSRPIEQQTA